MFKSAKCLLLGYWVFVLFRPFLKLFCTDFINLYICLFSIDNLLMNNLMLFKYSVWQFFVTTVFFGQFLKFHRNLSNFNKLLLHFYYNIIEHCINYKNDIKMIILELFCVVKNTIRILYKLSILLFLQKIN